MRIEDKQKKQTETAFLRSKCLVIEFNSALHPNIIRAFSLLLKFTLISVFELKKPDILKKREISHPRYMKN